MTHITFLNDRGNRLAGVLDGKGESGVKKRLILPGADHLVLNRNGRDHLLAACAEWFEMYLSSTQENGKKPEKEGDGLKGKLGMGKKDVASNF